MPGFTLETEDGGTSVYFPFGEAAPRATGGGPAIGRVARPKAKPLTEYTSQTEQQIVLSFKLSSFDDDEPRAAANERKLRKLYRLWGIDKSSDDPELLIVTGDPAGAIPYDSNSHPGKRWWLEDVSEDDGAIRNDKGNRMLVSGTVTLTEFVEDEGLDTLKVKKKKKGTKAKHYTVKKGDTLSKIAARLKIKGGWKTLQKLNPKIRDPKNIKPGDRIRIS